MATLKVIEAGMQGYDRELAELLAVLRSGGLLDVEQQKQHLDVPSIVRDIIAKVRKGGDRAAAVLPTGGTAKFFGPLSTNDFLKASSTLAYDATALAEDSSGVQDFARREGLTAHAAAVRARGR